MGGTVGERCSYDRGNDLRRMGVVDGTSGCEWYDLDLDAEVADGCDRFGDVRTWLTLDERFDRELNSLHGC